MKRTSHLKVEMSTYTEPLDLIRTVWTVNPPQVSLAQSVCSG